MRASGSSGSFAANVAAHRARVAGARPVAHATLEDADEHVRGICRAVLPWTSATWTGLLGASTLLTLAVAGVYAAAGMAPRVVLATLAFGLVASPVAIVAILIAVARGNATWRADPLTDGAPPRLASPTRCPCCHAPADEAPGAVCVACLARHHDACWREHGACASCRGTRRFEGVAEEPPRETRERPSLKSEERS